jgi:ATP-dependent 26S proteasome regulatory subunit
MPVMTDHDPAILRERAQNIWSSFARKYEPMSQSTRLEASPNFDLSRIGGLGDAKDEIQTYAYAATDRDVYMRWGTHTPSGVLLIGQRSVGKRLLARSLATLTGTSFLEVTIPKLVLEVIHRGGKVGELMSGWSDTLAEMPPLTVLFNELEFLQAEEIGARRPDLPVGPVMDFLLDMLDRSIACEDVLVVGSTAHPDTLRRAFTQPGRLERIVEVTPQFPGDIIQTLRIHAADAEKLAGRPLFEDIEWEQVVSGGIPPSPGDWVHILHAVLRRKARCEAAGEAAKPVSTEDFRKEVERFKKASSRLLTPSGTYV